MDTTTSMYNDILSYLTADPTNFSLSSINIQAAISDSLSSHSPTTLHSAGLTSESYLQSPWMAKHSESCSAVMRDGCSEVDAEIRCRYKTELCRPFEESGFCKYGNRCQFAHGKQELRTVDRHPKYKTMLCKTFHTTGLCRYGKRCHFIHNEDDGGHTHQHTHQQHQHQHNQQHQHQQQQPPVSGMRKLTGRQDMKSTDEHHHRLQTFSILPTSVSSPITRYSEQLSPVSGMSLPSSTASSPSPSLASFNDDVFPSSAAFEISQLQILRQAPAASSYSALSRDTDLIASHHPSILSSRATDSAAVQPKSSAIDRSHKEFVELVLRHLTKSQRELLVEYLYQREKINASF